MTSASTVTALPAASNGNGNGKRRLLDAALVLAARGTGFASMGIRELAREAGLNHNTFYRHFADLDDLAQTVAADLATNFMASMKRVRARAARHADATVASVDLILELVQTNPAPFVVGLRELHGGAPSIRRILRKVLDEVATDSVAQITSMDLAPGLSEDALLQVTRPVTYYMLYKAVECLDEPERRNAIAAEMVSTIRQQFLGAYAMQQVGRSGERAHKSMA